MAVRRLFLDRSGGLSGMPEEHLRQWLIDSTRDNIPDATNWKKVVAIVQAVFRNGTLAKEITWQTVVLIPKGSSGDFRGIGLVKVLWKAVTNLLNRRLTSAIKFHYALHKLLEVRGTGTTALDNKLLQQLTAMREAVLFELFLDLQKEYYSLDWDRCLEILSEYGVSPRTL